ncbi:hypothetical protein BN129_4026 [Cronobacter sakazakii 701]|nr:hypothetical protein BN129_4026 [Cronobacter sakazakii 701]
MRRARQQYKQRHQRDNKYARTRERHRFKTKPGHQRAKYRAEHRAQLAADGKKREPLGAAAPAFRLIL